MADNDPEGQQEDTGTGNHAETMVDPRLLAFLVCPLTKTTLVYDRARGELLSRAAGLAYQIRNGVPLMTEDSARELTDEEQERLRR